MSLSRNFKLLWTASIIGQLGNKTSIMAMPLIAVLLFNANVMETSTVTIMQFLPSLLFGAYAGELVKLVNKKRFSLFCSLLSALLTVLLIWGIYKKLITLWLFYLYIFCMDTIGVFAGIAGSVMMKFIVPKESYTDATHKLTTTANLNKVIAPSIGGAIVQIGGGIVALLIDGITFVLAFFLKIGIENKEPHTNMKNARKKSIQKNMGASFRFLLSHTILSPMYFSFIVIVFAIGMLQSIHIYYIVEILEISPSAMGIIFTTANIAVVLVTLYAKRILKKITVQHVLLIYYGAVLFSGMLYLLRSFMNIGLTETIVMIAVAEVFLIIFGPLYSIAVSSTRLTETSDDMYPGVISIWVNLTRGCIPIAALLAPLIAQWLGYSVLYVLILVITALSIAIIYRASALKGYKVP